MSGLKSIASLLSYPKHGQVKEIMEEQASLMLLIRSALPLHLSASCKHCMRKGRTIIIYADSAGMASQIRFYSVLLKKELGKAADQAIESIEIRHSRMQAPSRHADFTDLSRATARTLPKCVPAAIAEIKLSLAEPDRSNDQ
jgi:hypothetical protein